MRRRSASRAKPSRSRSARATVGAATSSTRDPAPSCRPTLAQSPSDGSASASPVPRSIRTASALACTRGLAPPTSTPSAAVSRTWPDGPVSVRRPIRSAAPIAPSVKTAIVALPNAADERCEMPDPGLPRSRRGHDALEPGCERARSLCRQLLDREVRDVVPGEPEQAGDRRERRPPGCLGLGPHERQDEVEDRVVELVRLRDRDAQGLRRGRAGQLEVLEHEAERGSAASLGEVGTSTSSPTAPRRASPGTGGPSSTVTRVARCSRPPGCPSTNGVDTVRPRLAAWKSGMDTEVRDAGLEVLNSAPSPITTCVSGASSTVAAIVRSGSWSVTIGSHVAPEASASRSAPPSASSTKATSASRWSSSASIVEREAAGSPNHLGSGSPSASSRPIAVARLPRTPRSSAAIVTASPGSGRSSREPVTCHRHDRQRAARDRELGRDEPVAPGVLAGRAGKPRDQLEQDVPGERDDRVAPRVDDDRRAARSPLRRRVETRRTARAPRPRRSRTPPSGRSGRSAPEW